MGIRHLNSYLQNHCQNSIQCVNLNELSGKKIAVDISIYLYKYEADNALIENMYVMLSLFRYYNIVPIFIFDGKPPLEKKEILQKRKEDRELAQAEYDRLQNLLDSTKTIEERQDLINAMDVLKKQIVLITKQKVQLVKSLIHAYGMIYFDAPGEADELCALLVSKKKVWACLSEDMDMFVYGCTRVMRYFSLLQHTVVIYSMKGILKDLNMNQQEFRNICILSGTDYNVYDNPDINLRQTLQWFAEYKKNKSCLDFYSWLLENSNYIDDIELLRKINQMFACENSQEKLTIFDKITINYTEMCQKEIENIMINEGFIFCRNSY
jgi:flap endonuclease-1